MQFVESRGDGTKAHNEDVRKATAVGNTVAADAFAVRPSGLQSRRVSARGSNSVGRDAWSARYCGWRQRISKAGSKLLTLETRRPNGSRLFGQVVISESESENGFVLSPLDFAFTYFVSA